MKKSSAAWWLWGILALEMLYISLFLLNYDMAWLNRENLETHARIFSNGKAWQAHDFARALDIDAVESNPSRLTRPVSDLAEIFNAKFRAWCWNYVPPHPSFSFLWPFVFLLTPLCFYRFFRNLGCNNFVAIAAVCLYMGSSGFLSPVVMLFHPAKCLVNFFAALVLYQGSRLYRQALQLKWGSSARMIPHFWLQYALFLFALYFSFFCDETGLFIYLMAALILCPIFLRLKQWPWLAAGYLSLPVLYYFTVHSLLPWAHAQIRGHAVDLIEYAQYPYLSDVTWHNLMTNFAWLLNDHPHLQVDTSHLLPYNPYLFVVQVVYSLTMAFVFGLFFLTLWQKCKEGVNLRLTQVLVGLLLIPIFVFFHTFILARWCLVWGVWWYGSFFSMVYVIALAFILQFIFEGRWGSLLKKSFVFIVSIATLHVLSFTTFRVDIIDQKSEHPGYKQEDIFTGNITEYYKNFSVIKSMKRSHCRRLYTVLTWAKAKQKTVDVAQDKIEACKEELKDDIYFPNEIKYLYLEL